MQKTVQLGLEKGVGLGTLILFGKFIERRHQRLRHKHASIAAKVAVFVRHYRERSNRGSSHGGRAG
ncbi:hypothetical protein GCM10023213_26710 [Prosthecobacter algae]|uniref:Uncharacterized protein n=1 Tax=Prosthecobacter algae TaxID=1144682 RepID=A0ABP9PAA5_9BACT